MVVPTVDDEKSTLLGTQNTRPPTIEMTEKPTAEDDGVLRRDRSRALGTLALAVPFVGAPPENGWATGRIAPSPFSLNTLRF
jgi:hypothetical protein